jgi:16S rRNA (uracil1498-N3)-methyltransferase
MTRIFVDKTLHAGQEFELPSEATRHVAQVLRLGKGKLITLFNGLGGEYIAEICAQSRRTTVVRVSEFHDIERESSLAITLVQGISRGDRMDISIQKAVELGVSAVIPFQAQRSTAKLSSDRASRRLRHWQGVVRQACEQCGRNRLPTIEPIQSLEQIVANNDLHLGLVMSPQGEFDLVDIRTDHRSFRLVVGPEGGLDERELEQLRVAGYRNLRVGPRILRTETAAIAGITLLQARFGDLSN